MEKRLGFVGIVVSDREKSAPRVNSVLSDYGEAIIGRMGLPNADESSAVITLIVKMSTDEMGRLTGRLGMLDGVSVRSSVCKK